MRQAAVVSCQPGRKANPTASCRQKRAPGIGIHLTMREGDARLAVLSACREQDRGRNGNDDELDKTIPFDVSTSGVIFSSGLPEGEMVNILRWSVPRGEGSLRLILSSWPFTINICFSKAWKGP